MDIVYTYVNSNDEEWKQQRLDAKSEYYDPEINNFDSDTTDRYMDNDELRYSLRSVEKHLQWIRNIYIVTNGQIPGWINTNKVKIINHSEIIPEEYLPTFNSHVIELYLHKIPGISSPFMYLNDDIIFVKNMEISDFITKENKFYTFLHPDQYTKNGIIIWE